MSSIIRDSIKARAAITGTRIPVSGKIRPGTKAINQKAAQNPLAMDLFRKAQSGAISFKDAEKEIAEKTGIKFPFFPRNTRHFNVYAHDVEGGQMAVDTMLELYGEQREGDSERKLYRFPIVFPDANCVEDFFPNEFRVAQGPIKYHSSYGDDGVRRCLYLKPVEAAQNALRKKHLRREETVRGECVPGSCPEFGSGACRFNGTLHFYIPGVTGSAPFAMATGSAYAAEDIFQRLDEIVRICNGRIPKSDRQGNPIFYMTKVKKMRTYFDESGKEKHGEQWVPFVETTLQMSTVLMIEESKRLQLAAPTAAPAVSGMPAAWMPSSQVSEATDAFQQEVVDADGVIGQGHTGPGPIEGQSFQSPTIEAIETERATEPTPSMRFAKLVEENQLGQSARDWAIAKFGDDWNSDDKLPGVLNELKSLLLARGAECCVAFLDLCTVLYVNDIPVRDVAMPYLVFKYGKGLTRDKQLLVAARMHVGEMLDSSGQKVALAHMQSHGAVAA